MVIYEFFVLYRMTAAIIQTSHKHVAISNVNMVNSSAKMAIASIRCKSATVKMIVAIVRRRAKIVIDLFALRNNSNAVRPSIERHFVLTIRNDVMASR